MLLYTRVKYAAEQSLYIMYEIISLLNDAIDQSECSIPKTCVLKLIFISREEKILVFVNTYVRWQNCNVKLIVNM